MKIKRLYIKDFGIFSHQELATLAPGLVLIGGWNRAGKSTFLQILRHLGFGFPRNASLPPAREKHEVEGEIALENGETCHFRLQGNSEPVVSYLNGNRSRTFSMQEIYGGLDPFTYHQVFTVSLDELQRLPGEIARNAEERLQAVLLGAGFAEIARLPQLEGEYRKKAAEIGGKYGKPGVQLFKEYFQAIRSGVEERDRALHQVDEYQVKKEKKREYEEEIVACSKELAVLRSKIDRLDLLKSNYEDFRQFSQLGLHLDGAEALLNDFPAENLPKVERLRERYEEALSEYRKDQESFEQEIPGGEPINAGEQLLREKEELHRWGRRLSGLREKARNYRDQQSQWEQEERELKVEMDQANEAWQGDFNCVLAVRTDSLEQGELAWQVEDYRKVRQELNACEKELAERESAVARLKELAGGGKRTPPSLVLNRNFALTMLFVLLGTGLSFFNQLLGIGVVAAGLIWMLFALMGENVRRKEEELYSGQLLEEKERYLAVQKRKVALKNDLSPLETEINKYRELLNLPEETPPEIITDYFRRVQELKKRIGRWRATGERLAEVHEEMEAELGKLRGLASRLTPVFPAFAGEEELFSGLDQSLHLLELAEKLEASGRRKTAVENELRPLLAFGKGNDEVVRIPDALEEFLRQGEKYKVLAKYREDYELLQKQILQSLKTDRAQKALQESAGSEIAGDDELFAVFIRLAQEYTSGGELEKEYERAQQAAVEWEKRLEEIKEEERRVQAELKALATTERLEKAQYQIDRARAGMRPLAEKYAAYSAAALFLAKIRETFLERARDTLLNEAGNILARLTAGSYQKVLPGDDLRKVDFKAVAEDGNLTETTAVLSRATQEQLFLAVRLSRIKEIPAPLPVILDDSLVNFDRRHLERSVELLKELAGTHQIFVLTCHPHLVEAVQAEIPTVQYWRLEKGRFSPTKAADLVKYLSG